MKDKTQIVVMYILLSAFILSVIWFIYMVSNLRSDVEVRVEAGDLSIFNWWWVLPVLCVGVTTISLLVFANTLSKESRE